VLDGRNAQRLFVRQVPREKRRLPYIVVSNCLWKNGQLTDTLRLPFDLLTHTTAPTAEQAGGRFG
jgi:hypothetical protein